LKSIFNNIFLLVLTGTLLTNVSLAQNKSDTELINSYVRIAFDSDDLDTIAKYSSMALGLSTSLRSKEGEAKSLLGRTRVEVGYGNVGQSIHSAQTALRLSKR
jgi:hypothetical protein